MSRDVSVDTAFFAITLIPFFDELREVLVNDTVFPIAAQTFEVADLLFIVLVVLSGHGK